MPRYVAGRIVPPEGYKFGDMIILMDGKEIMDIHECDDDLGFAVQFERDKDGAFIYDHATDSIKRKLLVGNIDVAWVTKKS